MPTLTDLKNFLNLTTNDYDSLLIEFRDAVVESIELWTDGHIKLKIFEEEVSHEASTFEAPAQSLALIGLRENFKNLFFLRHKPVTAVLEVKIGGATVAETEYNFSSNGILTFKNLNPTKVFVKYAAGYGDSNFPSFLKVLIKNGVKKIFDDFKASRNLNSAAKSISLGDFSVTYDSEFSLSKSINSFLEENKTFLEKISKINV